MRQVYNVVADVPHLGLQAGDVVVVRPGQSDPVLLVRPLPPNYGAVLGAEISHALVATDISPISFGASAAAASPRRTPRQRRPGPPQP
jgi:hypothetical protein